MAHLGNHEHIGISSPASANQGQRGDSEFLNLLKISKQSPGACAQIGGGGEFTLHERKALCGASSLKSGVSDISKIPRCVSDISGVLRESASRVSQLRQISERIQRHDNVRIFVFAM